ncbi:MAG: electron transfer flavoprotein subunit beta/FixA family protein [Deltaproteobacteria bacterium]|nr:electron transfer flavoprotein subunit beta/FixA family protein [Deltaproteobacteria bacterium]MBW2199495.1 electron transfer flavoprotein subunit beta/FixA family protein [Deltaproteobacteria bacterium]MBW2539444.1 electron transfer flavoprotein subunit beta/FixA family protein [Deltaproteobacteria bacterium]
MGLNIIVCIKSVVINVTDGQVVRSSESCELNPYDRPALELALRLREEGGGTVTAISMGPEVSALSLLEAMALGVDRSVLISDLALAGSDTIATSTVLAAAIKKLAPFDLILFGVRTADSDTGQVGPQTAVLLELPMVTGAHSIEQVDAGFIIERIADGFQERFEISFPAALTVHPRAVEPRNIGLYGIESAFEECKVENWDLNVLGLSPNQVGEEGSPTQVLSLKRVTKERKCELLSGSIEEQAEELIERLVETGFIG